MVVVAQSGNRFLVDPEDGIPLGLVVSLVGDELTLFPRVSHVQSILLRGYWSEPAPEQVEKLLDKLSTTPLPPHIGGIVD